MTADGRAGPRVLVVDDEESVSHVLRLALEEEGCEVTIASSAEEALESLEPDRPYSVAIVDIVLPKMNGLDLLGMIRSRTPGTEVVIMTSHASYETAIEAIRRGAYDYLRKPFNDIDDVWSTVRRALEKRRLELGNRVLLEERAAKNRKLEAAVQRMASLIDAGRAMADFDSLAELLNFFAGLVVQELSIDRTSIMLADRNEGHLRIVASRGLHHIDPSDVRISLGEGVAGEVAASGKPYFVEDADSDPRVRDAKPDLSSSFISAPIVLSIPIRSKASVLGVINATRKRDGKPFSADDLAYISGLAGQLAVAIERTNHFEELKEAYESLKSTQAQLVVTERLKATGLMAAGVAHDFNNALGVILGRTQLVHRRIREGVLDVEKTLYELEEIQKTAIQGAFIIKRIQNYTRQHGDSTVALVDLKAVISDAIDMTRPKWKEESEATGRRVRLDCEPSPLPPVRGNHHELAQVVSNLIFNAVEAMPQGGSLTVRSGRKGDRAIIEVVDTGVGMDEETRRQIFDPFFTTKKSGQGLGTSIIQNIVARHGGSVSVESSPGEGSTFRIELPVAENVEEGGGAGAQPRSAGAGRALRILYAEDEDSVRSVYREALVDGGHEVVDVASGGEAVALLDEQRGVDLVITDLCMPNMSGHEVARRVKKARPDLPVLLLTGWDVDPSESGHFDRILSKPCPVEDLLEAVQGLAGELEPRRSDP